MELPLSRELERIRADIVRLLRENTDEVTHLSRRVEQLEQRVGDVPQRGPQGETTTY